MRQSLLQISALSLAILLLSACRKHESIPKESTYTFTNQTGRRISLDVYGNQADYGRDKNRLGRYIMDAGADQKRSYLMSGRAIG